MPIPLDSVGTVLKLIIKEKTFSDGVTSRSLFDVSGATVTKQIIITKPSGTVLTKAATFTSDGIDGEIQVSAASGDLNEKGTYFIRGRVVIGSLDLPTSTQQFEVEREVL